MAQRKPTSINIDRELYKRLGIDLLNRGTSYSDWFEEMIRHWLAKPAMEEMPRPVSSEKQVCDALRKLLHKEKSLMITLPALLGITPETLEAFRDKQ